MKISLQNITPQRIYKNLFSKISAKPKLLGVEKKDTFEKSNSSNIISYEIWSEFDLDKITVTQNPLDKAKVYKKIWNQETQRYNFVPIMVDVAKSESNYTTTFHFVEKKLGLLLLKI